MVTLKLRETMWAEQSPDVYGGEKSDEIVPLWSCRSENDKGDSDTIETLQLAARTFPPGTQVWISEPLCPQCDEPRQLKFPIPRHGPTFAAKCDCGFDWDEWTRDQYS